MYRVCSFLWNCIPLFNSGCVIHPSTYFRLAKKYGLQLVAKERFDSYYETVKEEGRSLLGKMQALEVRMQVNCYFVFTSVVIYFAKKNWRMRYGLDVWGIGRDMIMNLHLHDFSFWRTLLHVVSIRSWSHAVCHGLEAISWTPNIASQGYENG